MKKREIIKEYPQDNNLMEVNCNLDKIRDLTYEDLLIMNKEELEELLDVLYETGNEAYTDFAGQIESILDEDKLWESIGLGHIERFDRDSCVLYDYARDK